MWLDEERFVYKRELVLAKPLVNASGTLGFTPDPRMPACARLGAFITNPISFRPRKPAAKRDYLPFQGGFLLHSGLPNPGMDQSIRRYGRRWAAADLPIIVHVLVEAPNPLVETVRKLEGLENILAVELGLPPACDPDALSAIMDAGAGELPLVPCLGPEQVHLLLGALKALQPSAVHLVEPRGVLPGEGGEMVSGRLYGPAIFPLMLKAAQELVTAGLCVIANGGISARWQIDALMDIGVTAVGLGSVLWGLDIDRLFDVSR